MVFVGKAKRSPLKVKWMLRLLAAVFILALASVAGPGGEAQAQAVTHTCADGSVRALTPFNQNPCGSIGRVDDAVPDPGPSTPEPTAPAPQEPTPGSPGPVPGTITCDYGRVVQPTPFNPNPCAVAAPAAPRDTPDDFLLVYGETPVTGVALEDRLAQEALAKRFDSFVSLIETPDSFLLSNGPFREWGLGEPVFYRDRKGERVRWQGVGFDSAEASLAEAVERPDAVIAAWQTRSILSGAVLQKVHPAVPANIAALHQARLMSQTGEIPFQPTLLTWSDASFALAAIHEPGPELVGETSDSALASPARPGDWVRVYVTGITPADTVGVLFAGARLGAGSYSLLQLSEDQGGLYCIAFQVPGSTPGGQQPVQVETARATSMPGPYLTVER